MYLLPFGLISIAIVILDAISKKIVAGNMALHQSIPLWEDVFHITYKINTGGAWSLGSEYPWSRWFFVIFTLAAIVAIIIYIIKNKEKDKLTLLAFSFITGGGIGNMIDRIKTGEVVDFFDFCLIDYPVFNVADCFVVIGAVLLIICFVKTEIKGRKNGNN